jgi:NhaP-type Na+/H+ or K+/H+ antiporter
MESIGEFAEIENALLMLTTYILFGMVMVLPALERLNLTVGFYVLFSLTIIRMAPVAVSLIGKRLRAVSVLFIGWFGSWGIASILYILTVVAAEDLFDREAIYTVAVITIFMSILAHGQTAAPLSNWFGKRIEEFNGKRVAVAEIKPVPEMLPGWKLSPQWP